MHTTFSVPVESSSSFHLSRKGEDGIYPVQDLMKIRGKLSLKFENSCIDDPDSPILINLVEIMHFMRRIVESNEKQTLKLFFEPVLTAERRDHIVTVKRFVPLQSDMNQVEVLGSYDITLIRSELESLEARAIDLFLRFSDDLATYLLQVAEGSGIG